MAEFNLGQDVVEVGRDPLQVEHALVLQRIRGMNQQSARLRSRASSTLGAGKAAAAPPPRSGARAPAGSEPDAGAHGQVEGISIEDHCKMEWYQNAELRSEFSSLEQYTAWAKAAARGKARIFGQGESGRPGSRRERTPGEVSPEEARAAAILERWKKSPELRAEFRGEISRFAAYEAARARGATPARE